MSPPKSVPPANVKSLDPPETVRSIAKRLEDAGFETWCVGGAVRDALLGHPHLDWDLATAAKPPDSHAISFKFRLSQLPLRPPVQNRNEEIHVRGSPENGTAKRIPSCGVVLLVQ